MPGDRQSVAIVVPNYNHAAYLPHSLASIAAQTRPPDHVLIIDDASTDNSLEVIGRFISQHPNWRLIKHTERLGVFAGQNEALNYLKTDWISFLGADDLLHPTYIEKGLRGAVGQTTPNLICGCVKIIGHVGRSTLRPILLPTFKPCYISPDEVRRLLEIGDNYFSGVVCLYRRQAVLDSGGFDRSLESLSDGVLMRQLAIRSGIYFIPEILGYWRLIGTNYSTTIVTRPAQLEPLLARMRPVIAAEPLGRFPARYDEILDRRIRFGGVRLLATNRQLSAVERADRITGLLHLARWQRAILLTLLSMGYLTSICALVWLTLRTPPMSLTRFLTQWRARRAIMAAEQRGRGSD
jgi:glycosyltransferase involved in cell wall biosynthesis